MILSLIVAAAENNVIGNGNEMPWHLPEDMRFFRRTTTGHTIIMGRKTFDSIGRKPLPKRTNIIITRNKEFSHPGCVIVHSLREAIEYAYSNGEKEAFIIGGGQVYKEALKVADRVYMTRVHTQIEGDIIFPELISENWKLLCNKYFRMDDKNQWSHSYQVFERADVVS